MIEEILKKRIQLGFAFLLLFLSASSFGGLMCSPACDSKGQTCTQSTGMIGGSSAFPGSNNYGMGMFSSGVVCCGGGCFPPPGCTTSNCSNPSPRPSSTPNCLSVSVDICGKATVNGNAAAADCGL